MIAFLIQSHCDPAHVARLVARLGGHDVFIHLDRKTPFDDAWRSIDAHFVQDRVPVYWAGYSQIEATTRLLEAALGTGTRYDKLVLLSGSCYPARPVHELEALFAADGGHDYITYVAVEDSPHLRSLIERNYFCDGLLPWSWTARWKFARLGEKALRKVLTGMLSPVPRRWPLDLAPFHGSQWWALNPDSAALCVDFIRCNPAIRKAYSRAFAPDEQVFQTILGNSEFAGRCTGRIPFTGRGTYKTANLHLIHHSLTKWYGPEDFEEIVASGKFFVRKVGSAQAALLDMLDRRIDGEAMAPPKPGAMSEEWALDQV